MILLHTFPGKGPSNDTIYACGLHEAYRRQTEDRGGIDEHTTVAEPTSGQVLSVEDVRKCLFHYIGDPEEVYVGSVSELKGVEFEPEVLVVVNRDSDSPKVVLKDVPKRYLGHDVILCDEWFV